MTVRQGVSSALGRPSVRDRPLLEVLLLIQMATSVSDAAGVFLRGLVGTLAVMTVQSQPPPSVVSVAANATGIGNLSS